MTYNKIHSFFAFAILAIALLFSASAQAQVSKHSMDTASACGFNLGFSHNEGYSDPELGAFCNSFTKLGYRNGPLNNIVLENQGTYDFRQQKTFAKTGKGWSELPMAGVVLHDHFALLGGMEWANQKNEQYSKTSKIPVLKTEYIFASEGRDMVKIYGVGFLPDIGTFNKIHGAGGGLEVYAGHLYFNTEVDVTSFQIYLNGYNYIKMGTEHGVGVKMQIGYAFGQHEHGSLFRTHKVRRQRDYGYND